jgi:hypothetical protein
MLLDGNWDILDDDNFRVIFMRSVSSLCVLSTINIRSGGFLVEVEFLTVGGPVIRVGSSAGPIPQPVLAPALQILSVVKKGFKVGLGSLLCCP